MNRSRGLRREASILLPAALLLFALLAAVTLLSYRTAVGRFAAEREQATLRLAGALADAVRLAKNEDLGLLGRWLPPGAALAVYDAHGAPVGSFGFADNASLALPSSAMPAPATPRLDGLGPRPAGEASAPAALRAFVPFSRGAQRFLLRLDVPEPELFAQQRSLRLLTPAVLGLAAAAALLAIFFLRALMQPYEELLDKVRAAVPTGPEPLAGAARQRAGDDVESLLATFDRALAALRSESGSAERTTSGDAGALSPGDELSAVERTLGPQLESGLLLFDRGGALLAANPAAVELLGGDLDALRAAAGSASAAAEAALAMHPELHALVSAATADGRSIPRASVAIVRGGRRVELGLTLQALRRGKEDGAGGYLVLFADVTDLSRRESEERFAAGLAQLGELSAGVAHELRNSLATVQGYLSLAARRDLPAAAREELAEARREAGELARIVDDFLTFARPGSGALEAVDLGALLTRATGDPALAGVTFRYIPAATPPPPITGDPHLLQRALRNLLLNAAQATLARAARDASPPGPVVVRLQCEAGLAKITIDDSGTGLAPEIRDRLFEPFASGRSGGAGLGLALARRIVLMHGGSLELVSLPGQGARAELRLPLGQSDTASNT